MSLQYTCVDDIDEIVKTSKASFEERQVEISKFKSPRSQDLKLRLEVLKSLYYSVKDHEAEIIEALLKDFKRSKHETVIMELVVLYNSILQYIKKLPQWIKPEKIKESSALFMFSNVSVDRISLGSVLVISPFNYPVLLGLEPVAAAFAGGNSVVWKPSELVPNTSRLLEDILTSEVSSKWLKVVQGAVAETTRLIQNPSFDKIFYTGSTKVGAIVAQEAAKHLTPYTLELGGKSPVFITEHFSQSNMRAALKRIFFGAFSNSGQTCVASDYVIVHESQIKLIKELSKDVLDEFWPLLNKETDYTCMVHETAYEGAKKKLERTNGTKVQPSNVAAELSKNCLPPTVVFDVEWNDSLMKEENFAPFLPFVTYVDLDDAIEKVNHYHKNPLAMYIFSADKHETELIMTRVKSGACMIGDTLVHVAAQDAPFGGVRQSGSGSYHGKWSYSAFTHERTVIRQPFWTELMNGVRNPPYTPSKPKMAQAFIESKPNFNRDGSTKVEYKKLVVHAVSGALVALGIYKLFQS
ncbi:LAQU0S01e12178g1_1 [Lachancea quebecensis]|uniref:Aldehyde dehydrogenase n=1 Tax=Lachancea quebecensis TaxID=1654605 RepID=A0A0P1KMH2_9SACH|nr:LAQU0S01e12178g1_1 [Lachancea quebecensis]